MRPLFMTCWNDFMQTVSRSLRLDNGTEAWLFGPWQLKSAFQPIFSLKTGKAEIAGFEGLIRPFLGGRVAAPGTFFKNIAGPERQLAETVTRDLHMRNFPSLPVKGAMLFVNLDPSAFGSILDISNTLSSIRRLWAKADANPRRLVCEITENRAKSPALLFALADAIKANGFRLAIDDYGAEHSDAERLARLKPDLVKFDGRWIERLMATKAGYGLVKTMAGQFHDRGIETVFEGIETLEQLELTDLCGATYVQGYALARPEIAPTTFGRFIVKTPEQKAEDVRQALREMNEEPFKFRPLAEKHA